jgi:hypothetical protein
MLAVRQEIEGLWVELMMSDEEKDEFIGFIDGTSQVLPLDLKLRDRQLYRGIAPSA